MIRKDLKVATDQDKARAVISDFFKQADKGADGWTDETGLLGQRPRARLPRGG